MRTLFVWTDGDANNHDWNDNCNWGITPCVAPFGPYPDGIDDCAVIPADPGAPWPIDLVNVSIGDLAIEGDVDFGAASGTVTLGVGVMRIEGAGRRVTVTIDAGSATIQTTTGP